MIRPITTQRFFLRQPSTPATEKDLPIARDLAQTLEAHRTTCVGMAANMIGQRKRIIAVIDKDGKTLVMLNPRIKQSSGPYDTEEGCLSLEGTRPAHRFRTIRVSYQDEQFKSHEASFSGSVAQAIQHEIDHCNGVVI